MFCDARLFADLESPKCLPNQKRFKQKRKNRGMTACPQSCLFCPFILRFSLTLCLRSNVLCICMIMQTLPAQEDPTQKDARAPPLISNLKLKTHRFKDILFCKSISSCFLLQ